MDRPRRYGCQGIKVMELRFVIRVGSLSFTCALSLRAVEYHAVENVTYKTSKNNQTEEDGELRLSYCTYVGKLNGS